MAAKRRKRRILLALAACSGLLVVAAIALPVWFPWVGRLISNRFRVQYASYERMGYRRFVLRNVTFTNNAVRFHAEKVESLVPTVWLWRRCFSREQAGKGGEAEMRRGAHATAENWTLEIVQRQEARARPPVSFFTNVHRVARTFSILKDWAPKMVLTNGTIQAVRQTLRVPAANWAKGSLVAQVELPKYQQSGTLDAKLGTAPYEVSFSSGSMQLRSVTRLSPGPDGLRLQSTNEWLGNRFAASAQFARKGLLPEQASVHSDFFRIPVELMRLESFEDLTGSLSVDWRQDRFAIDLSATARPEGVTNLPPIDVQIHSTGSTETAFIETAKISSPWLLAELTPGTEIRFESPFLRQEAVLKLALDLNRQPWFAATGRLDGEARLQPAPGKFPAISFVLSGIKIGVSRFEANTVELGGNLIWPWLDVSRMVLGFADASMASLTGQLQIEQRIIRDGHLQFDGSYGRQFLPAGYSFAKASGDVSFSGRPQKLVHAGQLGLQNFITRGLHPIQFQAQWQGERLNLGQAEVIATAGISALGLQGSVAVTNMQASLFINKLSLQQRSQPVMELERACAVSLRRVSTGTNSSFRDWLVKLEPFRWRGTERELNAEAELIWGRHGHLAGSMRSLDFALFRDFLNLSLGDARIDAFNLSADWNNGPANLVLGLAASMSREGIPFSADATVKTDSQGVSVQKLDILSRTQPVFSARGFLPLTITPADPKRLLRLLEGQPVQLQAMSQTNSLFWDQIAAATGLVLHEPILNMNVSGDWEALRGNIEMQMEQIQMPLHKGGSKPGNRSSDEPGGKTVSFENVRLSAELEREIARVKKLRFLLEGQPVALAAELPLGRQFWAGLEQRRPTLNWEKATARLKMENAQIAALANLFPNVLTPQGKVSLELALLAGEKLEGQLTMTGASTVPLGSLGVLRDIEAKMKFQDRAVDIQAIKAFLGGALVRGTGKVDLRGNEWLKGALPPFQFTLQGENVPLARNPDFVVRSDVNLTIEKTQSRPALIGGVARLRNSFYLRDLKDLLPGGVASPGQRPPYFSIAAQPFADWRLDLKLTGERFLKVNSPLFRGLVSADLQLSGTLKEPIALGNLKINSGLVQFPFANLDVTQGLITLTSEDPYRPQLLLNASSRRAGYDVKMELTGPADQPLVQFSSTPPLTSEQIVLMLTAGEMPRTEVGLTPQQRASRVALFLGKNLLAQFGMPGESERLTVRTGENISETGKPTYSVEYKLSRHWALVGEYDQFNAFNVGLKWKIYSK